MSSPSASRRLALAVLCTGMLMIILDGSIVTVALPSIQRDLHFTPADLTWTVNAYMIAFGGLLLLAGRFGDLFGRRRMFVSGLALFTAASLLCGLSPDQAVLIGARFLQGAGAAMTASVSLGMVVMLFPEPVERGKALGAFAFTGAAGASIGQVLGGELTQALNWHWIFLINLPIGIAAIAAALRTLTPDEPAAGTRRPRADLLGAVLVTAGLMLVVYTIVETDRYGWESGRTAGSGVLALALLAAFVLRQARIAEPLLPLRIFRSRNVAGANLIQLLAIAGMFGFQVMIALYMQQVLGYGAEEAGLALLPAALAIAGVSLGLSAGLIARFGHKSVLLAGLVMLMAAMALLTRLPVHAGYAADLLPSMLLISGGGLVLPALTGLGMASASPSDAGVVSGVFNTAQQVGGALGVAVLSTLAASRTGSHRDAASLTSGFHVAFATSTVLLATAAVIALVVLGPGRKATASETAQLAEPVTAP
jgi:EmrB/QacA subfamily drug resistance transporter